MTTVVPLKTILAALVLSLVCFFTGAAAHAQDSTHKDMVIYSIFLNKVPDHFKYPLIGFVNMAEGSQRNAQVGFINLNEKKLDGAQVGYVNSVGGTCRGAQVGFVNLTKDSFAGAQIGYVNMGGSTVKGTQIGFVNVSKDSFSGAAVGFVNVVGNKTEGLQVAFVNMARDSFNGLQTGFVNIAGKGGKGSQIGFVNVAPKTLHGPQIGFINIVDSIDKGVPLGFISYVRKNGYQAFELSFSEMYPVNFAYKIGVKRLYSFISVSYNSNYRSQFATGLGLGSILQMSPRFYFNPELSNQTTIERSNEEITTLATHFGCSIGKRFSIAAGPSLVWSNKDYDNGSSFHHPFFSFFEHSINRQNNLHAGFRVAARYTIK